MKTKVEKGLKYLTVGIFFMALVLNVKFTLDSPYFLTGHELVAQTTGTGTETGSSTSTSSGTGSPDFLKKERCWDRGAYRITSIRGTIGGGLSFDVGDILNTKLQADAGCQVVYEGVNQYEITCPATTVPQQVECQVRGWEECASTGCPCSH